MIFSSHLKAEYFRLPYKLNVAGVMVSIPILANMKLISTVEFAA